MSESLDERIAAYRLQYGDVESAHPAVQSIKQLLDDLIAERERLIDDNDSLRKSLEGTTKRLPLCFY